MFYFRNTHNYLYSYSHEIKFRTLFKNDQRLICDFFNVNKATAYRWIQAGKPTNKIALRLLDIAASGFMPCTNKWDGFFIFNDSLVTPKSYVLEYWEIDHLCEQLERLPTPAN